MTGHFKIVFSDIDGTLLDSQNRVPVKTREAILELEQRGIPFVLISARSPEGMEPIKRELGNHAPMVSFSGGLIQDAACGCAQGHVRPGISTALLQYLRGQFVGGG